MIIKHLWHIAIDKETLWVKWVNTEKLKGRSIWVVNEENSDSWGWKTILRLRNEVREFMIKKIGDGASTNVVYDHWSTIGVLQNFITNRDIQNARLNANTVVRDMIVDGVFHWPAEWINKYPILNQIQSIAINDGMKDQMIWRCGDGKEDKFSVKQTYADLQGVVEQVEWYKIVWFTQNIPKHSFILWMAILNKLTTQDKIRKWGSYDLMVCPLCYSDMDSHQHLFFQCDYAKQFWSRVKAKMGIQCDDMEWKDLVNWYTRLYNGNTIGSVTRRIGLAACVYFIWQERNWRLFREQKRSISELYEQFYEIVRMRLLSLKVRPSKAVLQVQKEWDVSLDIVGKQSIDFLERVFGL